MQALTPEQEQFIKESDALIAETHAKAIELPPNTVQVWPGGQTFKTIQAAVNSITGSSAQLVYQVAVGPGTYNEQVMMKDYIAIVGAGDSVTTIAAPAAKPTKGVLTSAMGCSLGHLTILGKDTASAKTLGIGMNGTGNFNMNGVVIGCGDERMLDNDPRGISNGSDFYAGTLFLNNCNVAVFGGERSTSIAIDLSGATGLSNPVLFAGNCNIQANSKNTTNIAVRTTSGATATLNTSKIAGASYALLNSDGDSVIVANKSRIDGPVSPGVEVNG